MKEPVLLWLERILAVLVALLVLALTLPGVAPEEIAGAPRWITVLAYVALAGVPVALIVFARRVRLLRVAAWLLLIVATAIAL
jgi:hypothetical protein